MKIANQKRRNQYLLITTSVVLLIVLAVWLFWQVDVYKLSTVDKENHFFTLITSILIKLTFIAITLSILLPQLSKKRNLPTFLFQLLTWLAICYTAEVSINEYFRDLLNKNANKHNSGSFNPFHWLNLLLYIFIIMIVLAYHFTKEWIKNEKQKRELIETQFTTEVKFLKNQINPHFLFNTLNNLFSIAQKNNDPETANGISKLAGLMRYMLYESSETKVSLEKEINNIKDFITLNKMRYSEGEVIAELVTKGEIEQAYLSPMLLLPFVENAFKHGVNIEEITSIHISLEVTAQKIIFTITNPVSELKMRQQDGYGGIGLENVKRRLVLLYPNKHTLVIKDDGNLFMVQLELNA